MHGNVDMLKALTSKTADGVLRTGNTAAQEVGQPGCGSLPL